ncbi:MAG: DegQ family serine endoprotease [Gammaproteobacteria bacterium]
MILNPLETTALNHPIHRPLRRAVPALLACALACLPAVCVAALPLVVEGQELPSLAPMVERASPAVVNISTESTVRLANPLMDDPFFRRFFRIPERMSKKHALGSGVIIDARRGLILTNNHVIAEADQISVKLNDGRVFEASKVGTDPDTEVAVIRIPAENLVALPISDSDKLRVGDFVVAIGNPFGLDHTVTSGIVSALGRRGLGANYEDFIQTDAAINPGNSGGALVNLRGELVGINTAIYSRSGGSIGIGFAIPTNIARAIMEQLVQYGEVKRGFIGTQMQDLNAELADAFGVKERSGAVLVEIAPDSPAQQAGLRAGDIIVGINGQKIGNASDAHNILGFAKVGDTLKVELLRAGKREQVTLQVAERKAAAGLPRGIQNTRLAGVSFGDLEPGHPAYGQSKGVVVMDIEPGAPAWRAGLREGDVVLSVNRVPVPGLQDFLRVVGQIKGQMLLQVRRGDAVAFMVLK